MINSKNIIVKVASEKDFELVIPFFESIVPDCNKSIDGSNFFQQSDVTIGDYWFITEYDTLASLPNLYVAGRLINLKEYELLYGVPETFKIN